MTKNILTKFLTAMLLITSMVFAQDEQDVDAIEKARQAKEAAEKAAAEASAATEAAIEAAAQKAAKEAREDAKRKKEEEEARKLAEAKAAEEAELDAAATAAAEEAKRKMAEELGLDYNAPSSDITTSDTTTSDTSGAFVAKEPLGINIGLAASAGFYSGKSFTSVPFGATVVLTTPLGFKVGPFDYTVSLALGGYSGKYESEKDSEFSSDENTVHYVNEFNPSLLAVGGNLTLANLVFAEGHVGYVGSGPGFRGFAGVTLDRLMKKSLNLPINLLVGSELFYSSQITEDGNTSGWLSLGIRLDYSL
tara:strand:- start:1075 stop:1995 length:921 start_codon:yes stop_codon:yes gene_type:complete